MLISALSPKPNPPKPGGVEAHRVRIGMYKGNEAEVEEMYIRAVIGARIDLRLS
jgi:hypothetical protein